ncbi:MAG: hypothetical protein L0287_19860 [Anaerolineae bacterium]|nr:hypothetical protein [Anaerolineae bacterium]
MQVDWRTSTWKQFGAAIDMLGDVINLCPDHLWTVVVYTDPDDERYVSSGLLPTTHYAG